MKKCSVLLIAGSLLLLASVRLLASGERRTVEGVPFVKLSGSYSEMGTQYGSLLKGEIAGLYALLIQPQKWERFKRNTSLLARLESMLQPKYVQFLKGVAAGSGIDYDMVLVGAYDAFSLQGCTSVLAKVPDPGGGSRLLHAKNLDNGLPTGAAQAVVEFHPEGELSYIVTEVAGIGMCDGMNEKGITLSLDVGKAEMRTPYPMSPNITFTMSEILSSSTRLAHVDARLNGYASDIGWILICGSRDEADGIIYDVFYDNLKRNPMKSRKDFFATNTPVSPDLTPPEDLLKCPRYGLLDRYLKMKEVLTVDDLIDLMSNPGTGYGVNNSSTKHSVIYDPRNRTLYVAFADTYAAWGKWLKYDWSRDQATVYREPIGVNGPVALGKTPSTNAVSIRASLPTSDSSTIRGDLDNYVRLHGLTTAGSGYVIYHGQNGLSFDVEVVQPVTQKCDGSAQVKSKVMPPAEMASVVHYGTYRTNAMGYSAIQTWLSLNGYKTAGPYQESYIKGPWNEYDSRKWTTEIRVPVKKRTGWFDFWPFRR